VECKAKEDHPGGLITSGLDWIGVREGTNSTIQTSV